MKRVRHKSGLHQVFTSRPPQGYFPYCPVCPGDRPVLTENPDQRQRILTLVSTEVKPAEPRPSLVQGLYSSGVRYSVDVVVNKDDTLGVCKRGHDPGVDGRGHASDGLVTGGELQGCTGQGAVYNFLLSARYWDLYLRYYNYVL